MQNFKQLKSGTKVRHGFSYFPIIMFQNGPYVYVTNLPYYFNLFRNSIKFYNYVSSNKEDSSTKSLYYDFERPYFPYG